MSCVPENKPEIAILTLDGESIKNHEIDMHALAGVLDAFSDLVEKANHALNKGAEISFRVQGGFQEGSFKIQAVLDFIGSVLPVVPQVIQCIRSLIGLKFFLEGEKPQKIEKLPDGNFSIYNSPNSTMNVNTETVVLLQSSSVGGSLSRFVERALPNGAGTATLSGGEGSQDAPQEITKDNKPYLLGPKEEELSPIEETLTLQVLSPNFKPGGLWRFYDAESGDEFSAHVEDEDFFNKVANAEYKFSSNTFLEGRVRTEFGKKKKHSVLEIDYIFEQDGNDKSID